MRHLFHRKALALLLAVLCCLSVLGADVENRGQEMELGSQVPGFRMLEERVLDVVDSGIYGLKITILGVTASSYDPSIIKDSRAANSGLPDLAVSNLRLHEGFTEPLPNVKDVTFDMDVENTGAAPAGDVSYSIHMDNKLYKTPADGIGTLEPGEKKTVSFQVRIKQGGVHSVIVKVNEDRAVQESSYTNNNIYKVCNWKECVCLVAEKIQPKSGLRDIESSRQTFLYRISNLGHVASSRFYYKVETRGENAFYGVIPALKGGGVWEGEFQYAYKKAGTYLMRLMIDMEDMTSDVYRADNILATQLRVTYDTEPEPYRWDDAGDLSVAIQPGAAALMQNTNAGPNALESGMAAMRAWNGINMDVSVGDVTLSESEERGDEDITVTLFSESGNEKGYITLAQTYAEPDANNRISYAKIQLNAHPDAYTHYSGDVQRRTLTHELGHAFGLDHPTCEDTAIMRQSLDPKHSMSIEPHDRYNLNRAYETEASQ